MRGWMLAGARRSPGPLIGTVVASATAAALTVAALSVALGDTSAPAGRLAGASVVVAGDTSLRVTVGHGDDARQSLPLPAYRGVPAGLAGQLARVPGVAAAAGESGFPGRAGRADPRGPIVSGARGPGLHDRHRSGPRGRRGPERGGRAVRRPGAGRGAHSADRDDLTVRAGRHDRAGRQPA